MTKSITLWQANQDLAQACLNHPFVQNLGKGNLPPDTFAFYVGQDAFFLAAFARAYSIAAAKTIDISGFEAFHALAGGVLEELKLHQGYAATWGVDLATVQPSTTTQSYTDFLLATAWSQDIGMTVVAMAPCMRLYVFLGQTLAQTGIPDHAYSEWIRTYSSNEFEQLAQQLEALVEYHTPFNTSAQAHYRHAMRCERNFFQSAWHRGAMDG
jgi:thiaminase (transcriptional activator TenA)